MKKFFVVLIIGVMLVTMCACGTVKSTRFMSDSQIDSVRSDFPVLQAEMTIGYTVSNQNVQVKVVYDLLLEKAPLATITFIRLVNDGFYDDTVMDRYNSDFRYMTLGRYLYKDSQVSENKKVYLQNASDLSFKGEFKSNNYSEPSGGYAHFNIFSLAMYHEDWTEDNNTFDSANGYLIFSLATENRDEPQNNHALNSDNYAVFAEMKTVSVKYNDGDWGEPVEKVPSSIQSNLTSFTSNTTRTIYEDATEETSLPQVSIMTTAVTVHFEILGDYDWSKLPTIG